MPSEQERALEYRRMMQARQNNRLSREKELSGDPDARRQLDIDWSPMRHWDGWDPTIRVHDEEDDCDP